MVKFLAFYLPQFHPIPENDRWWGKGFTEWTNVASSKPLFRGHQQPRVPTDLGHYDLRVPETRANQAQLAFSHGISGFCYYHYWFNGKRLLERPFSQVLETKTPELPFCLCWANESWSRRWLGEEKDVLIEQTYSNEDDREHAKFLVSAFGDSRYFKVGTRPLFLIYRPADLPNPAQACEVIKTAAVKAGIVEPFIVGVNAHNPHQDCRSIGLDYTLDFRPQLGALPGAFYDNFSIRRMWSNYSQGVFNSSVRAYEMKDAMELMGLKASKIEKIPTAFVGWDNTPRRGEQGIVIKGDKLDLFEMRLRRAIAAAPVLPGGNQLVFINAWNEWAEGNYLEPDVHQGRSYLETLLQVVKSVS